MKIERASERLGMVRDAAPSFSNLETLPNVLRFTWLGRRHRPDLARGSVMLLSLVELRFGACKACQHLCVGLAGLACDALTGKGECIERHCLADDATRPEMTARAVDARIREDIVDAAHCERARKGSGSGSGLSINEHPSCFCL